MLITASVTITGAAVAAVVAAQGGFGTVEQHTDLAGRPRFVTATRLDAGHDDTHDDDHDDDDNDDDKVDTTVRKGTTR